MEFFVDQAVIAVNQVIDELGEGEGDIGYVFFSQFDTIAPGAASSESFYIKDRRLCVAQKWWHDFGSADDATILESMKAVLRAYVFASQDDGDDALTLGKMFCAAVNDDYPNITPEFIASIVADGVEGEFDEIKKELIEFNFNLSEQQLQKLDRSSRKEAGVLAAKAKPVDHKDVEFDVDP